MIAIRRVAESGPRAWAVMDARFATGEGEDPKVAPESPEGPAEMVAELDVMVAYIAGDQVLDHLAYAELLRRDRLPAWAPGRLVPPMWPKLMDVLDDGPLDRMAQAARYLDVTLAVARDVLVAHPDPLAVALPMYSSGGNVALHRPIIDDDRKAAATKLVRQINRSLKHPWPDWEYRQLVDTFVEVPDLLERPVRDGLRQAYRLAGFDSPRLTSIIRAAIRLVIAHRDALPPAE